MFGFTRVNTHKGIKIESRKGKIFIGIGGDIYAFHIDVYRLSIAFLAKREAK